MNELQYCITALIRKHENQSWVRGRTVPFTHDGSDVRLHAADLADLDARGTRGGPVPRAGSVEIHRRVLNAGTPGRGLPVEHHAWMVTADSPLLQGWSRGTLLPVWTSDEGRSHRVRDMDNAQLSLGFFPP